MINLGPVSESDWRGANSPAKFRGRARRAIHFEATRPVQITRMDGRWISGVSGEDSVHSAIARLEAGGPGLVEFIDIIFPTDGPFPNYWYTTSEKTVLDNIVFVNDWLAITQVKGTVGTDVEENFLIFTIKRLGDWDVVMKGLTVILYRHGHKLRQQVYSHVLHNLMGKWMGRHDPRIAIPSGLPCLETENHVLMIETSRYLTNQLLYLEGWKRGEHLADFDNQENGLATWLLELFKTYLQHDFWEFNSKPYQRYTIAALQNIFDFAWDEPVKLAARMVMDYISAKTAVSSNGLRRAVPFRRQRKHADKTHLFGSPVDAHTSRMLMLSGLLKHLLPITIKIELLGIEEKSYHADDGSGDQLLLAAISAYRVPEFILDLLMNKQHYTYYQRFFHGDRNRIHGIDLKGFVIRGGIEIYASNGDFLLSSGGAWFPSGNLDFDELLDYRDCANAIPTTLMPKHGPDRSDFIQIVGEQDFKDQINTGVLPGFACGFNVFIPPFYRKPRLTDNVTEIQQAEGYYETVGDWTFLNAADDSPNKDTCFGFHVAAYIHNESPIFGIFLNFGFFEVAASRLRSFAEFKQLVLSRNGSRNYGWTSKPSFDYDTTDGRRIHFSPPPDDKLNWCILAVNGVPAETNIGRWPLARGDIMNSRQRPDDANEDGRAGWLSIDNPFFQQRLVLDMRNPVVPRRYQFRKNASRHTAGALVSRDVFRLDAFWSGPNGAVNRIAWDAYVHEGSSWSFPIALTPPIYISRFSPLISTARTSENTDLFWLGGDGSIWSCRWHTTTNGGEWTHAFKIPIADPTGKVAKYSGLAAVAKVPDHLDLFWIDKDGRVWTHWCNKEVLGGDWTEHNAYPITPAGDASPKSNIIAIAPHPGHVDVFWTDAAGTVRTIFWEDKRLWAGLGTISNPGEAAENCSLSANARTPVHTDVFWVSPTGAIRHTVRSPALNNGDWTSVDEVAPAGDAAVAAWPDAALASVSRIDDQVDIYWITRSGAIEGKFWNDHLKPLGWRAFSVAPVSSAHIGSSLHAVSRDPETVDLLWTGPNHELRTHWWNGKPEGSWREHTFQDLTSPKTVRLRSREVDVSKPPSLERPYDDFLQSEKISEPGKEK